MTVVELRPLGVKCNIACHYCYQNPQREAGNMFHRYDLDAMMHAIDQEGGQFALFGGEPLLMPLVDLEKLWRWGFERNGRNSIQTNGALITDEHVELFKLFNVQVGISMDGPGELNAARWAGSVERTRETTQHISEIIDKLCSQGLAPTLIVTLHRGNATAEKLEQMCQWLAELEEKGIRRVRLHLLEVDSQNVRDTLAMSAEENRLAMQCFASMQTKLTQLQLDLFEDQQRMLSGDDDGVTCVWGACDPYTTAAVRGVEGNGESSNCGRTNKDGVDFPKAAREGFERYLALYHTPQEHGGCQGCRFFVFCKGQCPGTGLHGDWRNRSEHCATWMDSYQRVEADMLAQGLEPLSLSPRLKQIEHFFLSAWERGKNTTLNHALRVLSNTAELPSIKTVAQPERADRLGFQLPPFLRINWTSSRAMDTWNPRFERLKVVVDEMQWRSVVAQVRPCAIVKANAAEPWKALGLSSEPVGNNRVVVGRAADLSNFRESMTAQDSAAVSELLGQPRCCSQWWHQVWTQEAWNDPIWPMAKNSGDVTSEAHGQAVSTLADLGTNPFWRVLGLYINPHNSCSFDCASSHQLSSDIAGAAAEIGLREEVEWLRQILRWPVEWSALHGIAETRTPVMRFIGRTDATPDKKVVRYVARNGGYPDEGATGIQFPYRVPTLSSLKKTNSQPTSTSLAQGDSSSNRDLISPILVESLAATTKDITDLTITNVFLTPYFTVLRLSNGEVGAAMSYYRQARQLAANLPKVIKIDPLWIHWLFGRGSTSATPDSSDNETSLLKNSLRVALLAALNTPTHQRGGDVHYHASTQPPAGLFDPTGLAVVIGFGGYIDRWANGPRLQHLHICDLGYASRRDEMEQALTEYRLRWPEKSFSACDGMDAKRILQEADYVSITASALANGTLDELLVATRPGAYVVVQGQSGAIHPAPLFRRNVACVATTIKPSELSQLAASDPTGGAMRVLLEGGLPWVYFTPANHTPKADT